MKEFLKTMSYIMSRVLCLVMFSVGILCRHETSEMIKCFIVAGLALIWAIWTPKPNWKTDK